jgi:serine/threonine protein kinase
MRQKSINDEIDKQVDLMRSETDKARLDRIVRERKFGDYDILDELGRGGMGVVYKAFHRNLKRMVALKIVLPEAIDNDIVTLKRFKREAELHARLSHPNIVNVYDSGESDGIHFFAMDFVTGPQLSKLIGSPEFSLRQRVQIAQQIAGALHHAHGHDVIHRDIKPDNIIVDAGWKANLVDFGIAKPTDESGRENITRQGLAVGTPHYMAPEQFRPSLGAVGPRTDVYSLGAVLFHTLAGHPPFEADSAHAVLIMAATQEAKSLEGVIGPSDEPIPADLAAIVARCMVKQPEDRYATAQDLSNDLVRFLNGQEVHANPLDEIDKVKRKALRHRRAFGLWAGASVVLATILGASFKTIELASSAIVDEAASAPIFTMAWVAAVGALLLLVTTSGLLIYRIRAAQTADDRPRARPDEIGVTADEV